MAGLYSTRNALAQRVPAEYFAEEIGPFQPYQSPEDAAREFGAFLYQQAGNVSPLFRPVPANWREAVNPAALEEAAAMVAGGAAPFAVAGMAMPKVDALVPRAKKFFGTTRNQNAAGYIMHDGEMLDFSGNHYGDPGTWSSRNVDHRELSGQSRYLDWADEELASEGGSRGMFEFMDNSGAVRWMPESTGATFAGVPTRQQAERIVKNFNEAKRSGNADALYIDFDNPQTMQTMGSSSLERPTVDGLIREAEQYYAGIGTQNALKDAHFTVDDFDCGKVSDWMRRNGYDSRGAEDALDRIGARLQKGTLTEDHKKALEFGRKK